MANWLLDYIEMTEYIPSELREQLTSIRELDLEAHNAMDELERDISTFFAECNNLSQEERQKRFEDFLNKCDVASNAASEKVNVADKLHDLVRKSMRHLEQALEKLRGELIEGDKAYIVEDLERRSSELDEQIRLEHENLLQRHWNRTQELKTHNSKGHKNSNHSDQTNHVNSQNNHHRHSHPALNQNNHLDLHHRSRNNSTGLHNSVGRQKKRERKRLNSAMTIFNRNSRSEDESTNQTFLNSPLTPDYLTGIQNPNQALNDVTGGNDISLALKCMMAGSNKNIAGTNDKSNGKDPLAGAKQPILTAFDAAHAVSPKATNSDKIVMFSSNSNGDNYNTTCNNDSPNHSSNPINVNTHPYQQRTQLSNHLLSTVGFNSGDRNPPAMPVKGNNQTNHQTGAATFSSLPLSSRHDPIMIAASQAINATQNMTPGRRTSSLKASYAAVNSGRLQTAPNQTLFEQGALPSEVYCKCRSYIHDTNMIACDNPNCKIEWFHYECVGITTPPEGEWYCDECRVNLGVHRGGLST